MKGEIFSAFDYKLVEWCCTHPLYCNSNCDLEIHLSCNSNCDLEIYVFVVFRLERYSLECQFLELLERVFLYFQKGITWKNEGLRRQRSKSLRSWRRLNFLWFQKGWFCVWSEVANLLENGSDLRLAIEV